MKLTWLFISGVSILPLILVLAGCATRWVKPGATEQTFLQDSYVCKQEARYGANQYRALIDKRLYRSCLYARGWRIDEERKH